MTVNERSIQNTVYFAVGLPSPTKLYATTTLPLSFGKKGRWCRAKIRTSYQTIVINNPRLITIIPMFCKMLHDLPHCDEYGGKGGECAATYARSKSGVIFNGNTRTGKYKRGGDTGEHK